MNNFLLFSKILGKPWAIDYREAILNAGLLNMVLDDHALASAFFEQATDRYGQRFEARASMAGQKRNVAFYPRALREKESKEIKPNSTAVIPITGSLMKQGDWCSYGMEDMAGWLKAADSDKRISNILLWIDSPGGTVDGTQALADTIKGMEKPVLAFVDGLMASAALWIGSAAQHVVARNSTTEVGSVGVVLSFADIRPMWEREGVKFHTILSSLSKDKNREFLEALKGEYDLVKELSLDPLATMFIDTIKANRPGAVASADTWNTGRVFFAEEAIKLGLIDGIADFDAALDILAEMTPEKTVNQTPKPRKSMDLTNLLAALGLEAIEASEEGVFLNTEQLAAIEAALSAEPEKSEEESALQQNLADATANLEQTTASLTEANETITRLQTEQEELSTANATLVEQNQELATQVNTLTMEVDALKEQDEVPPGGAHSDSDYKEEKAFANDPEAQAIYSTRKKLGK